MGERSEHFAAPESAPSDLSELPQIGPASETRPSRVLESRRSRALYLERQAGRLIRRARRKSPDTAADVTALQEMIGRILLELRALEDECGELHRRLGAAETRREDLLDSLPVPCVLTDAAGIVIRLNQQAASTLNVSAQAASGHPILLMFDDREAARHRIERLPSVDVAQWRARLRPRDRRPRPCTVVVHVAAGTRPPAWRWFLLESQA
jgi:PAS domain-containing protein